MSELKAFTFGFGQYTENGSPCVVAFDDEENPRLASDENFYIKSEADKVIAEKDKNIAELEERIADGDKDFEMADHQNERLLKIVRHNKYKRCLDMGKYWLAVSYQCVDDKHRQQANRHRKKWLKLAEKFKEAK